MFVCDEGSAKIREEPERAPPSGVLPQKKNRRHPGGVPPGERWLILQNLSPRQLGQIHASVLSEVPGQKESLKDS